MELGPQRLFLFRVFGHTLNVVPGQCHQQISQKTDLLINRASLQSK